MFMYFMKDILITDVTFRCSLIIEEILKTIPYHIGFSSGEFQDPIISSLHSIPTPPSYIPMMMSLFMCVDSRYNFMLQFLNFEYLFYITIKTYVYLLLYNPNEYL